MTVPRSILISAGSTSPIYAEVGRDRRCCCRSGQTLAPNPSRAELNLGFTNPEDGEHVVGVGLRVDLPHHLDDGAVGVDHERRALDAHVLPAGKASLAPDAVGLGGLVVGVGEQRERQLVLGLELRVRALAVWA